ncbi:SusD/RagB family nutrient-binding outer membrane lipoprotein [Dyadobacter sp. CY312]|uniref:SusD/RagB family nutrient-binding outer membrane lipoprotein n=1 Tax=Dyadobacter sp. CY312 TaxID=2907303 RepID=UPI001F27DF23|nr:SusD/RagB family nutrient-binding outer membrane lipoprotein [Dyadobacter sp. CY312]MCE7040202.1 SusD/RagB family nutrient-binding outer membrane lipoprotein [Dyadobacter sp. CY312]
MKKIFVFLLLLCCSTSCFKDSDINIDPNRSVSVDPALLFSGAATQLSLLRVGELTWPIALGSQMWASGARWGLAQAQYDQTRIRSAWGKTYTDVLKNLGVAVKLAETTTPVPRNAVAQCKILQAFTYSQTSFLWGDIPFSEAANGEVNWPKFDKQQDVLNGCLALLDEALGMIDTNSKGIIAPNDLYYGGDMVKWKKFANSLKLRILFAMVDSDGTKAAAIGKIVTDGSGITSVADAMQFKYFNEPGRQNPRFSFTAIFRGGVQSDWYCSKPVYDLLVSLKDPRIPYFFQPGPEAGANEYIALNSVESYTTKSALVSLNLLKADLPEVSFSYSEQLLFEAEAYARGFASGGFEIATTKLRAGVSASLISFGVPAAQAEAYATSLPALTAANYKDVLAKQQYLDLFMRPVEGWTQHRRSGVTGQEIPVMTPPVGSPVTGLMRRLLYRNEELNSNPNTPSGIALDVPQWFDK